MTSEEARLQFQSVNARCDTIEAGQTNIKSELVQTNEGIARIELTLSSIHLNAHPQPTIMNSATPIQGTYQLFVTTHNGLCHMSHLSWLHDGF